MTKLEMIAKAIWDAAGVGRLTPWKSAPDAGRAGFINMARAAVRAQMGELSASQHDLFAADDKTWRERTASSVFKRVCQTILDESSAPQ